ncbi:MnhB domain-containing protein [Spirochaetota bacterium]
MIKESDDIIIKALARVVIPFIQIYALYVIMHGHYSPGGGFQGGVILGASIVLLVVTYGIKKAKVSNRFLSIFSSAGVLMYAGIGLLCLILLGNFLDYNKLAAILPVKPAMARSLGILGVELGVGFAVMAVMVSIFYVISTGGDLSDIDGED